MVISELEEDMSTKEKILEAALTLFAENGYDGTSVEQIAGIVGIKAPSLYKHYKGKEDILNALIDGYFDMVVCMDGVYCFDQDYQHHIRVCHAEEICCSAYDHEQGDRRAAFHASTDVNNSSDYIHGNPDMFSSDICSCSGGILHKDRKAD